MKRRGKKNVPAPSYLLSSSSVFFSLEMDFATKKNPKFEKEPILEVSSRQK
jgi:hypothetical protein